MKAGIIAAGLGERFRRAGVVTPKPLVEVAGRTLLERAIDAAADAGAEEIALIVNAEYGAVERFVRERTWPVAVGVTVKTTPNSMESLFALEPRLRDAPFLLLTVDAVLPRGAPAALARAGLEAGPAGTLAVTTFVDDEKPLRVALDDARRITGIGAGAAASPWITSGVYFFFPVVYAHVDEARRRGLGALREYLALLVEKRCRLGAFPIGRSIDVDCPQDVAAAERFLAENG